MDMKEKLVEILRKTRYEYRRYIAIKDCEKRMAKTDEEFCAVDDSIVGEIPFCADFLIANGVTLDNQVASSSKQLASSEWISVKDRLPDLELVEVKADDSDLFPCLAVRKHPRAKNGKYTAKVWYDGYGFIDGISNDVTDEITHWMPLPPPPKGE